MKKTNSESAEKQLRGFIGKFAPTDRRLIRAVRTGVRKRFPTANELVYDNYNFFVIGYSPTKRPSGAIVSIAARANGVGLCFIHRQAHYPLDFHEAASSTQGGWMDPSDQNSFPSSPGERPKVF